MQRLHNIIITSVSSADFGSSKIGGGGTGEDWLDVKTKKIAIKINFFIPKAYNKPVKSQIVDRGGWF